MRWIEHLRGWNENVDLKDIGSRNRSKSGAAMQFREKEKPKAGIQKSRENSG